jgi:hypothetical protein
MKNYDSSQQNCDVKKSNISLLKSNSTQTAIKQIHSTNTQNETDLNDVLIKDDKTFDLGRVKDKFSIVYAIFLMYGIAILLPWNIFITATEYFVDFKLNTNTSRNATYRTDFTFYIGLVGQVTNAAMNIGNILITFGG